MRIDEDTFRDMRREVLSSWPTGREVSEEAFGYYRQKGDDGIFHRRLREAKAAGKTLLQPRGGVPLVEKQIELLQHLETVGTADLLPLTVDSYTRQNRYEDAQRYLEQSQKAGTSLLNGFPVVNHGVAGSRAVLEAVSAPVQIRHGSPDARLLAEISFAAGYTSFEGGGITYNLPYSARVPLERSIRDWQYVDRLSSYYTERGVTINRESYGALTGILVPPSIAVAISVFEALLAAEQGVKSITVGYGQNGNIVQDVAAVRALEDLTCRYLHRFGFGDVEVTTCFHQWMGPFPMTEGRAFALIALGALTAALARATKVITKTPHEAYGVPTKEANAQGLLCSRLMVDTAANQYPLDREQVAEEARWIDREATAIVEKALELGEGQLDASVVRAFEAGVMDLPFCPSIYARNKVMPIRDESGAVRFLEHGNLPFDREILEWNRELVHSRAEAGPDPLELIEQDINFFLEPQDAIASGAEGPSDARAPSRPAGAR
ncbi:MAG: methylaspartate mutase subunit E [Anaerolineales bacterium]